MSKRTWIYSAVLGCLLISHGHAAEVIEPAAAQNVVIEGLKVTEGAVSGTIVNQSSVALQAVRLNLSQTFLWDTDRKPTGESPGRTLQFEVAGEIPPKASAPFNYEIPPLQPRTDGRYVSSMSVTSFTEIKR